MLYAGWTLVSAAFSPERATSFTDCKQLVLLLLVPLTYDIVDEASAMMLTTIILAAGAVSAVIGIGQYSILHYDNLGQRPRSTLGLYMTFSGLMMLVLNVALARVLFMTRSRLWPTLVIPALAVVLPLSLSRNAWVGACCGVALLLMMRDFRLTAVLPVAGAIFFAIAPAQVLQRFYSIFNLQDLDDQRSVRDDARRQADHRGPSRVRRRTEHDRARLPAVSRSGRRAEDDAAPPQRAAADRRRARPAGGGPLALVRRRRRRRRRDALPQRAARRPAALPLGHRARAAWSRCSPPG